MGKRSSQRAITIDTHALLWYLDMGQNKKLSMLALQAIADAEHSGIIYVPAIVIMETFRIIEKGRFSLRSKANAPQNSRQQAMSFLSMIENHRSYQIVAVHANLMRAAIPFSGLKIHDRLIAATAVLTDTALVSRDRDIAATGARVLW